MNLIKKQRASSVLGLALHGNQLEGVVLRRTNGSLQIQKSFSAVLALSPLSADPELVGREIRNHIESAGIRERRCVLALPLSAALSTLIDIPEIPAEDVESFLEIEAERGFPYGQDALLTSTLRFGEPGKPAHAMLVAYQRSEMGLLDRALRAAQLKPLSFTIGTIALQPPRRKASDGVITLVLSESNVDLQVTAAGGIASLRSLSGTHDSEGTQKGISAELLAREIRITLGQLPPDLRDSIKSVRIYGQGEPARRFADEFATRAQSLGINAQLVESYRPDEFVKHIPGDAKVSAAFSAAARYLGNEDAAFEFLPPRVTAWQQLTARFSSKKLAWIGAAAGATALLVGGAFAVQQFQLSRLDSEWSQLDPKVRDLDEIQQQIRKFRPWYDERFTSLTILKKVTESFPAEGSVTAKTLEIRELSTVTCSGTASDNLALLRVLDQLRNTKEVANVKVDQVRGKTPMQFTFNFQWNEGGANGR